MLDSLWLIIILIGQDTSENDLQSPTAELSEMSVQILYGPGKLMSNTMLFFNYTVQKIIATYVIFQGLERHLLGSHGLVTASMQDLANKGQDSGRCPVCGKVYQWKLLNHVAKDHMKVMIEYYGDDTRIQQYYKLEFERCRAMTTTFVYLGFKTGASIV